MLRKTMVRIVITAIVFIALAGAAVFALVSYNGSGSLGDMRSGALNFVIDQSGIKQRIEDQLYDQANEFAEKHGVPVAFLNSAIETLDVQSWKATSLPEDASENGNIEGELAGHPVKITSYDDPSYVTVDAYGQSITFEVPESAKTYTSLMPYASQAKDLGLLQLIGM